MAVPRTVQKDTSGPFEFLLQYLIHGLSKRKEAVRK